MADFMKQQINGNDILYYFLKSMLDVEKELALDFIRKIIISLGIWMAPDFYKHLPVFSPFVIRDTKCRGNKEKNMPERWGEPTEKGYFKDDNSIIKGFVRSFTIHSPFKSYNKCKIGNAYVASHVWRRPLGFSTNEDLTAKNPWLNSFVPNLVWLPQQLSKLSDREGGYVQTFIQKVSYQIYHDIPTDCPSLTNSLWSKLPLEDISDAEKITLDNISFFIYDEKAIKRRKSIILNVINALQQRISGKIISSKVVSDRYTSGLNSLSSNNLIDLKNDLENYISQLSQI